MSELDTTTVGSNGVELRVGTGGEGTAVVFVHGFPELGRSWRHQAVAFVEAGYRVLVPDLRGYGGSSRPADVAAYDIDTLAADVVGLLDAEGIERAVFVGHDWGAAVVWHVAVAHPERVLGVAGLSVPHTAPPPVSPLAVFRKRLGEDFYMLWFQEPGAADEVLAQHVREVLALGDWPSPAWASRPVVDDPVLPAWLPVEEYEFAVGEFTRAGFTGGLNYYRNIERNWEIAQQHDPRIARPAFFLTGADDPVGRFTPTDRLAELLPDLRGHVVVPGAGHWLQHERAGLVTGELLRFVDELTSSVG